MKKILTSWYTPFALLLIGLLISLTIPVPHLEEVVGVAFFISFVIGLGMQAVVQYRTGNVGLHWTLNILTLFAMVLRAIYMIRTGQYWLSIPDIFGVFILGVLQLQCAGLLLKKKTKVNPKSKN